MAPFARCLTAASGLQVKCVPSFFPAQVQLWDLRKAGNSTLSLGGNGAGQQQVITSIGVKQKAQMLEQGPPTSFGSSSSRFAPSSQYEPLLSPIDSRMGPYFQQILSHPQDPHVLAFVTRDGKVSRWSLVGGACYQSCWNSVGLVLYTQEYGSVGWGPKAPKIQLICYPLHCQMGTVWFDQV